jgi:hypothetical protein
VVIRNADKARKSGLQFDVALVVMGSFFLGERERERSVCPFLYPRRKSVLRNLPGGAR